MELADTLRRARIKPLLTLANTDSRSTVTVEDWSHVSSIVQYPRQEVSEGPAASPIKLGAVPFGSPRSQPHPRGNLDKDVPGRARTIPDRARIDHITDVGW